MIKNIKCFYCKSDLSFSEVKKSYKYFCHYCGNNVTKEVNKQ